MTQAKAAAQPASNETEEALRKFHEESAFTKTQDWSLVVRLWKFVRPHRAQLFKALAYGVVVLITGLARPIVMQWTIDEGILKSDVDTLTLGAATFAGLVFGEQIFQVLRIYAAQLLGARVVADLRAYVFGFIHTLRMRFFDQQPVGRLVTRVTSDTDAILELASSGALNIFTDLLKLVGVVVLMLSLDWKLSLVAFSVLPPIIILVREVRKRHRDAFREIRAKTARMNSNMNEQVSGMMVVQAFGRQLAAADEFDDINAAYRDANIRSIKYDAMQDAAIEMVMAVSLAAILVALGYHPVSFGVLVAFNAYVRVFFEPISALAQRYTIIQSSLAGAERIFGLTDSTEDKDAVRRDAAPDGDPNLAIELDDVSFSYKEGVPVLKNVTLAVKPGEKIAIVGPTGSGKTTVASLLLRLYEVNDGVVRIFGKDVVGQQREALREQFSVVPQDVFLFPGTVADNIAAGATPDRERVQEVLRRLDAWDLFASRPGGLDAPVEERGHNFSSGERQLIVFARAMYRQAPVLILDEATASVDSDTESRLQAAVDELMRDRTAIIIAHRLSTIQAADRIVVMQQGRVREQGTHEELLAAGGLYARLHQLHFTKDAE